MGSWCKLIIAYAYASILLRIGLRPKQPGRGYGYSVRSTSIRVAVHWVGDMSEVIRGYVCSMR